MVFSIVPLAILFAGVGGLVLQHDGLRVDLIDALIDALPLAESEDRSQFEDAFEVPMLLSPSSGPWPRGPVVVARSPLDACDRLAFFEP